MTSSLSLPNRPLSVKEISDQADAFERNTNIPLKAWLRTAHTLYHEGEVYMREGNFAQAYLLYLRYSTLLVDVLKIHPEAKSPEGKKALKSQYQTVNIVLNNLEKIKPIVQREYEEWQESESRRQATRDQEQVDRAKSQTPSTYEDHASIDPALSSSARLLDAGENQELAVDLAQRELQRRDASRKATRKAGVSHQEEQKRRIAGFWDNWTHELADRQADDEEAFRKQMESTRRRLDGSEEPRPDDSTHDLPRPQRPSARQSVTSDTRASGYRYPSISKSEPVQYDTLQPKVRRDLPAQPPRPPKESPYPQFRDSPSHLPTPLAPERPGKEQIYPERTASASEQLQERPTPPPKARDPASMPAKQQRLTFKPAAYLENGEPIRPIFLPAQLRDRFLSIASENTRRGLEMCGILCGTAVNNALFVRCLLIPEQKCTSDTCETENEGSMLEYCINEDLLMLGWIHTHPTQTCFMSSRDLHTQSGYQVMMPESIAIVCAPKFKPSYGIFRLTNPPGLPHVLNCTQSATFHQHHVDNLYTQAGHPPGHVYENEKLDFYVHDLRPGAHNSTLQRKNF
ncbi:Uu.00g146690.m01.CDS01 [Anthostomella pinea]|uniref:Uu.00g146690.m01.CDS01 n=1 Tax=Anthostomella pinea TaxID=933095 RepID=A0AAI8VS64_9PEZI|nr:Uu.00g146690.m01.CDS01 [Anthostomella pinea]